MQFHGVDGKKQFKRMRELAPEAYRGFLEFDAKVFKDGALSLKTKELMALAVPDPEMSVVHRRPRQAGGEGRGERRGAGEATFVAMALAAGQRGATGARLQCLDEHRGHSLSTCDLAHGSCAGWDRAPEAVSIAHRSASPHLRQDPSDAEVVSHRLMVRAS
jgi:hypothetical protein